MEKSPTLTRRRMLALVGVLAVAAVGFRAVHAEGNSGVLTPTIPVPGNPPQHICMDPRIDCNPATDAAFAASQPLMQPPSAHPVYVSRQVVEGMARRAAHTMLTPSAPTTALAYSALMSRPQFETRFHEGLNFAVNRQRLIWVVTVHAPMADEGGPARAPLIHPVYSIAYDAETGQATDACIGCAWLQQSE